MTSDLDHDPVLAEFAALVVSGATPERLLAFRNRLDPKDGRRPWMNDEIRRVTLTATMRANGQVTGETPAGMEPLAYGVAYRVTAYDPESVYAQAGTQDPEAAARWYAEGSSTGASRLSSYRGCLDALTGQPSKVI